LLFAVFVQPLIAPLTGRGWLQAEVFGVTPDPTVVATLGVVLASGRRARWRLGILPFMWCALSGAVLWTLDAPVDAVVLPIAAILVLVVARIARAPAS
jgi:hypothetical protein